MTTGTVPEATREGREEQGSSTYFLKNWMVLMTINSESSVLVLCGARLHVVFSRQSVNYQRRPPENTTTQGRQGQSVDLSSLAVTGGGGRAWTNGSTYLSTAAAAAAGNFSF